MQLHYPVGHTVLPFRLRFLGLLAGLFLLFTNAQAQCSLTISKVTTSGCYPNGGSKATVSVEVAWTNVPDNEPIKVQLGGQTRTIMPLSAATTSLPDIQSPQTVAFEIDADGGTGSITATSGTGSAACSFVSSYSAPAACLPLLCTDLGGTVFNDYNADGIQSAGEQSGLAGVSIKAIDKNGTVYTTLSDRLGRYALTIPSSAYPVRVEFGALTAMYYGTPNGTSGRTSVQFVAAPNCNVSMGVLNGVDYCPQNPDVTVSCFINGDPLAGGDAADEPALVSFPYTLRGNKDMTRMTLLATGRQVGALWGSAFNKRSQKLYTSAVLRRHTGLGPNGLGGIYVTDLSGTTPTTASTSSYVDVAALGINVGSIPARNLPPSKTSPSHDPDAFPLVGKVGIGSIALSDDGSLLWFTNLADRQLYSLRLPASGAPTASDWAVHPLPNSTCTSGIRRIWAVKVHKGKVYVGAVCDATTSKNKADLRAIVYAYTPTTGGLGAGGTFETIFDLPLTYPKGWPDFGKKEIRGWFPWEDDFSTLTTYGGDNDAITGPQPILSDLEFDIDGSMVLGFADRLGLQLGYKNYGPVTGDTRRYNNISGGDILRAYADNGTYVLENAGKAGPNTGTGPSNDEGPGAGEFYNDDFYYNFGGGDVKVHSENAFGGLALRPGSGEVITTAMDPLNNQPWSGGVRYLNNSTGTYSSGTNANSSYVVYKTEEDGATFGKAVGLGNIELACAPVTYQQLGNRVWRDSNGNGIQDPGELPLAGVQVELLKAGETTPIASVTTDSAGEYYFSSRSALGTAWTGTGADTTLLPNAGYILRIKLVQTALTSLSLTTSNATGGLANDGNDSDATIAGNYAQITLTTGQGGTVDHADDFGFTCAATPTIGNLVAQTATCAGTTANNDGQVRLSGIQNGDRVSLFLAGSTPASYTAATNLAIVSGAASFTGLANPTATTGTAYTVRVFNGGDDCFADVMVTLPYQPCTPVCSLVATATPGTCNSTNGQYTLTGTVSATTNITTPQTLTISSQGQQTTVTLTGTGSANYSIAGLPSDGSTHQVTVVSSALACGSTQVDYSAPSACLVKLTVAVSAPACNPLTNQYTATGIVSLTNSPSATLRITDNGVPIAVLNLGVGQTTATFSVTGLSNGPSINTVVAALDANTRSSTTYTVPQACTVAEPTYAIGKTVDRQRVEKGQVVTYTVSVTNTSPVSLTGLIVTDQFSNTAVTLVGSATASSGTFTPTATGGNWSIGSLGRGEVATLTMAARLDEEGLYYNQISTPDGQTVTTCTTVPIHLCAGTAFEFVLSAPNSFSAYQWSRNGQPIQGATSATYSATMAGEYSVGLLNSAGCSGGSCCPFVIVEDAPPSLSATTQMAHCMGTTPQHDAAITLVSSNTAAVSYNISKASSFTTATPLFSTPQPLSAVVNGVLIANQANPVVPTDYTIRVYSANGCYSDVVVTLQPVICPCPPARCAPFAIRKTKSGGVAIR